MTTKAKAALSDGRARIVWRLLSNVESIAEGFWWLGLAIAAGLIALVAWPVKEIRDSWEIDP